MRRELQAVCDTAPDGQWCWAQQATDALGRIHLLVSDAVASNAESLDQIALAAQVHALRSAALIGVRETSARSGTLMKKHNAGWVNL